MKSRYEISERLLAQAENVIPLGSQTFSKSKTQFPFGASPYFITHGKGSKLFDVDGNEYIDFISSLAAVTLGYCDPDVNLAVIEQVGKGSIFSLASPLEMEVAEKIVKLVPCAEKVRFGKNGSDVTAGAIRLARAFTGRDKIIYCGYHGWQDWYIGSTSRNLGVPKVIQDLTHSFEFNDLDSLEAKMRELSGEVAAIILEPMNIEFPSDGFLENVKKIARKNGSLLIFDEIVTGFRIAKGGAQELFGVVPDLACLGKGLANGFPLSALVGRHHVMSLLNEVYFSFTFGGETISLAAANATLDKITSEDVTGAIFVKGKRFSTELESLINQHKLTNILSVSGHPSWSFLRLFINDQEVLQTVKTLFMQEMMKSGILCFGSHILSYAHSEKDIDALLYAYDKFFKILKSGLVNNELETLLDCEKLESLFQVRRK